MNFFYGESLYPFELLFSYEQKENGLLLFDKPKEGNAHKLTYLAKGPSFEIVSNALQESTYINHITGKPFVISSILYQIVFTTAIHSITFEDEELDDIEISEVNFNTLNHNLIKMVAKDWIKDVL